MSDEPTFPWSHINTVVESRALLYALEAVFNQLQRVIDSINTQTAVFETNLERTTAEVAE